VEVEAATYWLTWVRFGQLIAVFLVAIGVVAEFAGEYLSRKLEIPIDAAREEKLAALTAEATSARAAIAEANARAAEANQKAEEEKLARVKIEEKLAPRRFTNEQASRISAKMAAWSKIPGIDPRPGIDGLQQVAVFPVSSAFEPAQLADQLAAILGPGQAGWNINRNAVTYGMTFSVSGIGILTSSNLRGIAVADALAQALVAEGMLGFVIPQKRKGCEDIDTLKERVDTDPFCSAISVFVGDRPL
jgi:hypothetical protein